jgi:hypothetical protein
MKNKLYTYVYNVFYYYYIRYFHVCSAQAGFCSSLS